MKGHARTRPLGVRVQKVQRVHKVQRGKVDGACGPEGCGRHPSAGCVRWRSGGDGPMGRGVWWRLRRNIKKTFTTGLCPRENKLTALRAGKQANRTCGAWEMHSFCRLRRRLPRRGRFALCFALTSYVVTSVTVISHLRWLFPLWCLTATPSPRRSGGTIKLR